MRRCITDTIVILRYDSRSRTIFGLVAVVSPITHMRVLQVNKLYHPVVGGVENVVKQLADGCQERGHDVRVLTATERGFGAHETVDDVPVHRVSSLGTVLSTPFAPTFPVHLAYAAADSDVVHYHLPNPLAVVSHLLVSPDTPTVATYHSDIVRQARARRLYRPLLERFLSDVNRLIATSPHLQAESQFLQPHTEKTRVVPLGIDIDSVTESPTAADTKAVRPTDQPVVLFVGRLNYYKGVKYLIRAIPRVNSDAAFVVIGDGPRRSALKELAASLEITDQVHFLGRVDDATRDAWYASADLFVLPSVEASEAFGIVQLEAMARGAPVINTNLPTGVPWVSRDSETGLTVPPRDADALAEAIDCLLADDELRLEFSRAAQERVHTQFTESRMVSETLNVYRKLTE